MKKFFLSGSFILIVSAVIVMAAKPGENIVKNIEALKSAYEIDTDSLFPHLNDLEAKAEKSADAVEQSVYYSYLAEYYHDYYKMNRFFIDDRTDIEGPAPKDQNEWTKRNFYDAVRSFVDKSVKEKDALLKADIKDYSLLLENGKDEALRPTMYDVLMHRAIDILSYDTAAVNRMYEELIASHENDITLRDAAKLEYEVYKELQTYNVIKKGFAEQYAGTDLYVYALAQELSNNYMVLKEKHDLCDSIIEKYKGNPYLCSIERIRNDIERKSLSINNYDGSNSKMLYPDKDETVTLSYCNVSEVTVTLYRVNMNAFEFAKKSFYSLENSKLKEVYSETVKLPDSDDFEMHKFDYTIKAQDYGIYVINVKATDAKDLSVKDYFQVSRMFACTKRTDTGNDIFVCDRMTGAPLSCVTVNFKGDKKSGSVKTNDFGIATIDGASGFCSYALECGKDQYYPAGDVGFYTYSQSEYTNRVAKFFLDRGVYRPGQKVMAKGILYSKTGNNYALIDSTNVDVTLYDVNHSKIATQKVQTNSYGSFYVEFDIPTGLLSGDFSISTSYGRQSFKVEEYKRPTFEVDIDNVAATTIADSITVKGNGKYYRGMGTGNAKVTYNVTSCPVYFCNWAMPQIKASVASGEAECDADGNFCFEFMPEITPENTHPFYRLSINVNVTDGSGESESASYSLLIGETSYTLSFPLSGMTDRDKIKSTAPKAYDTAGNEVALTGKYVIVNKQDSSKVEGEFASGTDIDIKGLKSGEYSITLSASDDKGRDINYYATFILYSVNDKKPAVESVLWVIPVKTVCSDNESAEFVLGSSFDSHILMEIYSEDKLVERSIVDVESTCTRMKLKYKKSFSNRVTVNLLSVKNGKAETKSVGLSRYEKPRDLNIELSHLKKTYAPGDKDVWSVKVTDVDGKPITAEVLASMYDMSLDAICPNSWYFNPVVISYKSAPSWHLGYSSYISANNSESVGNASDYVFKYAKLKSLGFNIFSSRYHAYSGGKGMRKLTMMPMMLESAPMESAMVANDVLSVEADDADMFAGADSEEEIPVRGNFAETAFFYPQLNAENGVCEFEFVAPEALTAWKIMLMAHNSDIRTALATDTIVTQKTLAVNTNLPRFVRTTDKAVVAANIDNLSDVAMDVDVKWVVTDMISGETIATSSEMVAVKAGTQGVTKCEVSVPKTASLLKIRVTAKGGQFTDGVEALVPVLSSQTLVTESMPICLYNEGDFTFDFESFATNNSETLVNRGYSVSLTPDAATLALQSLPYVGEPKYDNAVDYALAYYVNWLSAEAVEGNKNLKAYLERLQAGTQSVESPLSANEDLKNILLQESPWVMDAKFETERNNQLVELLNVKAQEQKRAAMLKKLFKLQNSDGDFAWFDGGKSSAYITLFVVEQLQKTGYSGSELKKAVKYLSSEMEKSYKETLKYNKNPQASYYTVKYMLAIGKQKTDSYTYYYNQVKKNWATYALPVQAIISQVLIADGDATLAKQIVNNIRKFSVFKPTLGMYWPNTSDIYTQADYIKAFSVVDPNAEELAKMKLWLLFNKQTNMWGNSVATADAIDALVNTGNAVGTGNGHVIVKVGGVTLDSDSAQWAAAIDCKFPQNDVSKELSKVEVSKTGTDLTLGAAYWQYTEDVDKVQQHTDERLALKKTYYKEEDGVLKEVSLDGGIKVGDIVTVRLVVTADRQMEFIHLRDLRPAGLEPMEQVSQYFIMSGLFYYMTSKDCSTDFFFDYMPKGTYVFEYKLKANGAGDFAAGFATIESMYADDFKSQTSGLRMIINN